MKERPSRHVLTELEVKALVMKHFPEYSRVNALTLGKMLEQKYAHSEHADLSFDSVDRQLKNPNSPLFKTMYALCLAIRTAEIINQHNLAVERHLAERDRFEKLPATASNKSDVLEVVKENLLESDHILVTNADLIKKINAQRDLISKSYEAINSCLLARHKLLVQRAADKAETVKQFNQVLEDNNLSPVFKMSGALQHRVNVAYAKAAKASGLDTEELQNNNEFEEVVVNTVKEDLQEFVDQKLDNEEVTRRERRQFLSVLEQLALVSYYGARLNYKTNLTIDELMAKVDDYHQGVLEARAAVLTLYSASSVNQNKFKQYSYQADRGLDILSPLKTKPTFTVKTGRSAEDLEEQNRQQAAEQSRYRRGPGMSSSNQ